MILGGDRRAVIENIRTCAENGDFHNKVELGDPVLTAAQNRNITDAYLENRKHLTFKLKTALAVTMAQIATRMINKNTEIIGLEKIPHDLSGVLITSNHFSPLENTVIRHLVNALGRRQLSIISQTSNFAMTGMIGFLMNYADRFQPSRGILRGIFCPCSRKSWFYARKRFSCTRSRKCGSITASRARRRAAHTSSLLS